MADMRCRKHREPGQPVGPDLCLMCADEGIAELEDALDRAAHDLNHASTCYDTLAAENDKLLTENQRLREEITALKRHISAIRFTKIAPTQESG